MNQWKNACSRLVHEEDGQSLIEYSLIAGIVAVGAIAAMTQMRQYIVTMFNVITNNLAAAF